MELCAVADLQRFNLANSGMSPVCTVTSLHPPALQNAPARTAADRRQLILRSSVSHEDGPVGGCARTEFHSEPL